MLAFSSLSEFKAWFETHVRLEGKPYVLDDDQARAVFDHHKNTLVTARAGSGKTRVIVAKIAYLVASGQARLDEIAAFMFNRTAAAEVNQRIGAVEIDGASLEQLSRGHKIRVASTFHKFALDVVKLHGEAPQLISEAEQAALIRQSLAKVLATSSRQLSPTERAETLRLATSFIARAGQKYLGEQGLAQLSRDVYQYLAAHQADQNSEFKCFLHQACRATYQEYLLALNYPQIDFNLLMARAIRILRENATARSPEFARLTRYKYLMVDEYQDFSYLKTS